LNVVFFDLESTALNGNWGRILCGSFAGLEGDVTTLRKDVAPLRGRTKIDDAKLAVALRKKVEEADIVVGWNSILFDIPLLNARLRVAGERPVNIGEKYGRLHLDLMYYAGGQSMRIGGRSLDHVSNFFNVESSKTKLDGEAWQLAAAGDTEAMDAIVEHCEKDVEVLRQVFPHLAPSVKKHQFTLGEVWPFLKDIPSRRT
jgi:uncharacterized protein YprB with RNaseH-like and TPR domain